MKESIKHEGDQEKRQTYENLCGGTPDAIYILARVPVRSGTVQRLKSGSYKDPDLFPPLISGGRARTVAGAELHKYFPDADIVTNSWLKDKSPVSIAWTMAQELTRSGVNEEKIELQENSYSTYTELVEMMKLAMDKGWKNIAVVLNEFQIERATEMLCHIARLRDPKGYWQDAEKIISAFQASGTQVHFVSAEDVLIHTSPRHKKIVEEAKALPGWKQTLDIEREAARQVRDDEYWKPKK